jgi:hypothetical protein
MLHEGFHIAQKLAPKTAGAITLGSEVCINGALRPSATFPGPGRCVESRREQPFCRQEKASRLLATADALKAPANLGPIGSVLSTELKQVSEIPQR